MIKCYVCLDRKGSMCYTLFGNENILFILLGRRIRKAGLGTSFSRNTIIYIFNVCVLAEP